jgi:hypothetical protein
LSASRIVKHASVTSSLSSCLLLLFSCTVPLLHTSNQIKSATMVPSPTLPSRVSRHRSVTNVARANRSSRALAISRRAAAKLTRVPPPSRDMQVPILKRIAALPKERREKVMEGGKKGRGILKGLIEQNVQHFPWVTRNMVDHYIVTYTDDNLVPLEIDTSINNQTVVSGLTDASLVALAIANVTGITAPTDTNIMTRGSESVSTSKRGVRPA